MTYVVSLQPAKCLRFSAIPGGWIAQGCPTREPRINILHYEWQSIQMACHSDHAAFWCMPYWSYSFLLMSQCSMEETETTSLRNWREVATWT